MFCFIFQSKTIRQFDDSFTSLQFGYSGYKDYYDDACIHNKIQHINIPLLCLNAADDPFSPEHGSYTVFDNNTDNNDNNNIVHLQMCPY